MIDADDVDWKTFNIIPWPFRSHHAGNLVSEALRINCKHVFAHFKCSKSILSFINILVVYTYVRIYILHMLIKYVDLLLNLAQRNAGMHLDMRIRRILRMHSLPKSGAWYFQVFFQQVCFGTNWNAVNHWLNSDSTQVFGKMLLHLGFLNVFCCLGCRYNRLDKSLVINCIHLALVSVVCSIIFIQHITQYMLFYIYNCHVD